jgi:hypothetical protein
VRDEILILAASSRDILSGADVLGAFHAWPGGDKQRGKGLIGKAAYVDHRRLGNWRFQFPRLNWTTVVVQSGDDGKATFRNSWPSKGRPHTRTRRWTARVSAVGSDSCSRLPARRRSDRPIISLIHKLCARRSLRGGRSIAINSATSGGGVALGRQAYLRRDKLSVSPLPSISGERPHEPFHDFHHAPASPEVHFRSSTQQHHACISEAASPCLISPALSSKNRTEIDESMRLDVRCSQSVLMFLLALGQVIQGIGKILCVDS